MGLLPDGDTTATLAADALANKGTLAKEFNWTLKEATRTPTLWLLIGAVTIEVLANGAVGFHQVAYFSDIGIAAAAAAAALSVYGLTGALSSGIWGFLVERVSARYLAIVTMVVAAATMVFLLFVDSAAEAILFAAIFGFSARGETSLIQILVAQYYGRSSFGAITGLLTPFQMVGLGLGPLVASVSFDVTGSYRLVFIVLSIGYLLTGGLLWLAGRPALPARANLAQSPNLQPGSEAL
jgi:MFS family permease